MQIVYSYYAMMKALFYKDQVIESEPEMAEPTDSLVSCGIILPCGCLSIIFFGLLLIKPDYINLK